MFRLYFRSIELIVVLQRCLDVFIISEDPLLELVPLGLQFCFIQVVNKGCLGLSCCMLGLVFIKDMLDVDVKMLFAVLDAFKMLIDIQLLAARGTSIIADLDAGSKYATTIRHEPLIVHWTGIDWAFLVLKEIFQPSVIPA